MADHMIVSDNFTRANSTGLGANWTADANGGFDIVSNVAKSHANSGACQSRFTGAGWTGPADGYAQVTIGQSDFPRYAVHFRAVPGGTSYCYVIGDNAASQGSGSSDNYLLKIIGGSISGLGSSMFAVNIGDVIRIECIGTTIRGLVNGVLKESAVDSDISAAGHPMIEGNGNGADDILFTAFEAGDFAVIGQPTGRRSGGIPGMTLTGRGGW